VLESRITAFLRNSPTFHAPATDSDACTFRHDATTPDFDACTFRNDTAPPDSDACAFRIVAQVEREKAGIIDPTAVEMKRPIAQHIADFEKHQKSKNNSPNYVSEVVKKVKRFVAQCHWRNVSQIKVSDVEGFLLDLREKEGLSIETSNHYLRGLKTFVHWLVNTRRLNLNCVRLFDLQKRRRQVRRLPLCFCAFFLGFRRLRHTFITNLGRAKVSPKTAQTLARHSDISLTMNIYSHVSEEDQIEAINALPGILGTQKPDDDEDKGGACVPA